MTQDETDAAARLAEALAPLLGGSLGPAPMEYATNIAIALLPVVRVLGDLRAAEELDRMGDLLAKAHEQGPARRCRNRAAALRGEAGR